MQKKRTETTLLNYMTPFIPLGFEHVKGTWDTGFVIADINQNKFTWIPVGFLEKNGTLNGFDFNSSFGLRNWYKYDFSENGWHENVPSDVLKSIETWGGFYLSSNTASIEDGKLVFKDGVLPSIGFSYNEAIELESSFEVLDSEIAHCLMLGSAYDCCCQWIIQTGTKTKTEIVDDSTYLGNYINNDHHYSKNDVPALTPCGSNSNWTMLNINDLGGNTFEFTQECHSSDRVVLRSGHYNINGRDYPVADRYFREPPTRKVKLASFRTMLFHK